MQITLKIIMSESFEIGLFRHLKCLPFSWVPLGNIPGYCDSCGDSGVNNENFDISNFITCENCSGAYFCLQEDWP